IRARLPSPEVGFFTSGEGLGVRTLTLGLAQIKTRLGDVPANLAKHLEYAERAAAQGVELLCFPELSLTGYVLQDLVPTVAHRASADDPVFTQLLDASHRLDLMVGFVDEDTRHRFFIAAAYLSKGQVLHVHHKVYLPTYGMFDEGRFFAWGDSIRAFDTQWGRVGMLICEDFWHASPPYLLWLDGADILLMHSASPGRGLDDREQLGSARWVEHVNQAYASLFTNFIAHTNKAGFEDGLNFWGGSTVFDPNGDLVAHGPYFDDALTVTTIDLNQLHRTRARLPILRDERTALVMRELTRIVQKD
ncbi:MAG TPA: nitrilase-related carbon-nitrogen hydrolase, partial [Anaerolineales bacterium]|nr:nitrilase-related carbon-nitrogen hydrolase [Anaerolineales bacterium]